VDSEEDSLLTITENGYGKRTRVGDYRKTKRGAKGVMTIRTSERNGKVVAVRKVHDDFELIVTSESGMVIRMPVSDIREIGRATQGVRIMRIKSTDKVITVEKCLKSEEVEQVLEEAEVGASASTEKKKISDADFAGLKDETNGDSE